MSKQLQRTMFTTPDYWLRLRQAWIVAEREDRRLFLSSLLPDLPAETIEAAIALDAEETRRHYRYQLEDAKTARSQTKR